MGGNDDLGIDGDDLSEWVTIVLITSPVASNPSTEMVDRCISGVVRSFPSLRRASIVVGCDGVAVTTKTKSTTARIYGKCSAEQYQNYRAFVQTLQARKWLQVHHVVEWQGFALTLKGALERYVQTPLVMVLPHDYELTPDALAHIHLPQLLSEMRREKINYIGLPNPRSSTVN